MKESSWKRLALDLAAAAVAAAAVAVAVAMAGMPGVGAVGAVVLVAGAVAAVAMAVMLVAVEVVLVVGAVGAMVVVLVAGAVGAVEVVLVAGAVAVVLVVAMAVVDNPKLSVCLSCIIIVVSIVSLTQTLPIVLNPPQMVRVICQSTSTATNVFIHNSTTQTITQHIVSNQTRVEIASKVSCP